MTLIHTSNSILFCYYTENQPVNKLQIATCRSFPSPRILHKIPFRWMSRTKFTSIDLALFLNIIWRCLFSRVRQLFLLLMLVRCHSFLSRGRGSSQLFQISNTCRNLATAVKESKRHTEIVPPLNDPYNVQWYP